MMDIKEIQEYLQHRYPFLLVDRVVSVEAGKSITAYKNVTINEPFFNGHFPGHPVMPGVLILEAMAQAAGLLGFQSTGSGSSDDSIYYFVGADHLRFKRPVVPGDRLMLHAEFVSTKRGIWKFDCRADVDDELVCSASIICAARKRPD